MVFVVFPMAITIISTMTNAITMTLCTYTHTPIHTTHPLCCKASNLFFIPLGVQVLGLMTPLVVQAHHGAIVWEHGSDRNDSVKAR